MTTFGRPKSVGRGFAAFDVVAAVNSFRTSLLIVFTSGAVACGARWFLLSEDERLSLCDLALGRVKLALAEWVGLRDDLFIPLHETFAVSARQLFSDPGFQNLVAVASWKIIFAAICGSVWGLLISLLWAQWSSQLGASESDDRFLQGTRIVSDSTLIKLVKRRIGRVPIKIGRVPVPQDLEPRHFAAVGATGAGKSTVLRAVLDSIESRGAGAIVYDVSGELTATYFNPLRGDILLNPFDKRGAFWNPMVELSLPPDADRLAAQLVPSDGADDEQVWTNMARGLVADLMRHLMRSGPQDLKSLVELVQNADEHIIASAVAGTASQRIFASGAERATASVIFNLSKCARLMQFLPLMPDGRREFDFRSFFKNFDAISEPKPWVFIQRPEKYFESTKGLIGAWLEAAASGILSLPPSSSRRIWLILDEFMELPKVDNIQRLLPLGRKYGACAFLTLQSIGQARDRYGKDAAEALLGQCNTKLFLQMADAESRRWASETLGDAELELRSSSRSIALQVEHGRTNLNSQRTIRPAVIESDFRLPRFQGFLLLPDGLPPARIKLTDSHIKSRGPANQPAFVPSDLSDTFWSQNFHSTPSEARVLFTDDGPV